MSGLVAAPNPRPGVGARAAGAEVPRRISLVHPPLDPTAAEAAGLYARNRRWVYGLCRSRLRSREDAEDALQLTFLYALRSLQREIRPERERAWLRTIAENVCRTRRRDDAGRARVESVSDVHAVEHLIPGGELRESDYAELHAALASLPESQRRALVLREWQGLSYREIATALALTEAAVETLLFRARRGLARAYDGASRAFDFGAVARLVRKLAGSVGAKTAAAAVSVAVVGATAGPPLAHLAQRAKKNVAVHAVTTAATPRPHVVGPTAVARPAKPSKRHAIRPRPTPKLHPVRVRPVAAAPPPSTTAATTTVETAARQPAPHPQPAAAAPAPAPVPPTATTATPITTAVATPPPPATSAVSTVSSDASQAVASVTTAVTSAVSSVTTAVPTPTVPAVTLPTVTTPTLP
jgi:RNA polymerase sigma factor (sigma-70 family)